MRVQTTQGRQMLMQLLAGLLLFLFLAESAWAVPGRLNFQGALTNADGSRLNDGSYSIFFSLYDVAIGGTPLWTESRSVEVQHGVFSVELGSTTAIDASLFSGDCYLGITVGSEIEMIPRQQLLSVAYSFQAEDADTLNGMHATDFAHQTHSHSTGDITSGDLAVTLFTSYGDLYSEGYLGNAVGDLAQNNGALQISLNADMLDGLTETHFFRLNESEVVTGIPLFNGGVGGSTPPFRVDSNYLVTNLNADYLDGFNSSSFASTSHIHSEYVAKSGDVMTGPLVADSNNGSYSVKGESTIGAPSNGYVGAQGATDFDGIATVDWDGFEIGVAGISTGSTATDNYGMIGHSNYVGVRGEYSADRTNTYGELGKNNGTGVYGVGTSYGVRGNSVSRSGVYGYSSGSGVGVEAFSSQGDGLDSSTSSTNHHAGKFNSTLGAGLNGSSLLAEASGSGGIAIWAYNSHTSSTDATMVLSNNGSGALLKGFGGNGGNEELRISNDGTLSLFNGDGVETISLDADYAGDGRITTQELSITGGSDISENFDINSPELDIELLPGMVVSIDPKHIGQLMVTDTPYDRRVAGIISGAGGVNTGMLMGQSGSVADGAHPVALTGRVYCLADTTNGPIEPGDMLTTSDTLGHAMRVTDYPRAQGAILGKSMSALENGKGLVLVLVSLQ